MPNSRSFFEDSSMRGWHRSSRSSSNPVRASFPHQVALETGRASRSHRRRKEHPSIDRELDRSAPRCFPTETPVRAPRREHPRFCARPESASHPRFLACSLRHLRNEFRVDGVQRGEHDCSGTPRASVPARAARRRLDGRVRARGRAPGAFAHPLARGVRSRGVRRPRDAPAASHRALQHGLRRGRAPVRQKARGDEEDHQVLGREHRERHRGRRDGRGHGGGGVDPPGFDAEDRARGEEPERAAEQDRRGARDVAEPAAHGRARVRARAVRAAGAVLPQRRGVHEDRRVRV